MANQKLNAVITLGAAVNGSVKRAFGGVEGSLKRVGGAIGDVVRQQREMDKQRQRLIREGKAVDDLDRDYDALTKTLAELKAKQERLRGVRDGMGRVGSTWKSTVGTITGQSKLAIGAIAGIGAAAAGLTGRIAGQTEEMTRFANRIGVTTEFLSSLDYVTQQYGVGTEDLVDGLKELSLRADEFAYTGVGPAAEAFERLGLSQSEVNNLAGDTAALFATVQDRLSRVQDVAARQRIADEVFGGTAGERMIEVVQLSREEMIAMADEARRAGAVVDQSLSEAAREFSREQAHLGQVMNGVFMTLSREIMPVVTDQMERLSEWLIANRPTVEAFGRQLGDTFTQAVPIIGEVISGVGSVVADLSHMATVAADLLGGWENLGVAVGALFVAPSVISIGKLGASLVGLIAATGPVGLVIAGIAAAALLIISHWDEISAATVEIWNGISETIGGVWTGIQDQAAAAVDWIVGKMQYLSETVGAILGPIQDSLSWVGDQAGAVGRWWRGDEDPQERAVGGYTMPGATLVGEQGPEIIFPDRQSYVATARQSDAILGGGGGGATITGGINIYTQPGQDAQAIADEVMRRLQSASSSNLYDGGGAWAG